MISLQKSSGSIEHNKVNIGMNRNILILIAVPSKLCNMHSTVRFFLELGYI